MVELVVQIALLLLVPLFGVLLHQWPLRWSAGGHDDKQNGKKQQFFHLNTAARHLVVASAPLSQARTDFSFLFAVVV